MSRDKVTKLATLLLAVAMHSCDWLRRREACDWLQTIPCWKKNAFVNWFALGESQELCTQMPWSSQTTSSLQMQIQQFVYEYHRIHICIHRAELYTPQAHLLSKVDGGQAVL